MRKANDRGLLSAIFELDMNSMVQRQVHSIGKAVVFYTGGQCTLRPIIS